MNSTAEPKPITTPAVAAERLPCRGCTRDCPNYASCDGRPWSRDHGAPKTPAAGT